jgi:hypothetical protein
MNALPRLLRCATLGAAVLFSAASFGTNSWNGYHWARTTSSFTLTAVDSMTADWQSQFDTTLAKWSISTVLDLAAVPGDESVRARKRCQAIAGQLRVCNADYGQNGWLGLASIYLDSAGHIVKGTAKMNDSYASYWTFEEMNHVVCQEVGHVLGLDHTSTDGSSQGTCMDYSSSSDSQWPNSHDYEELFSLYGHTDSYDSYATGGSGGGIGCTAPPGKGCNKAGFAGAEPGEPEVPPMGVLVRKDPHFEIWVAPGRDGGLWIHHVTLVPDDARASTGR